MSTEKQPSPEAMRAAEELTPDINQPNVNHRDQVLRRAHVIDKAFAEYRANVELAVSEWCKLRGLQRANTSAELMLAMVHLRERHPLA